jgi:photosystem II stability/assembly factor-like uncharacterized protein
MSDRILVGTRKGLFDLRRTNGGWLVDGVKFLGDPVTAVAQDAEGALHAGLDLGHFGVKYWTTKDGKNWAERPAPAFPPKPEGDDPHPWAVKAIWTLEPGGVPGRLWAGTISGGLFRSDDGGASWTLVRTLWDRPERRQWFGGGTDQPGVHSVCVDPRDPERVVVGVSCGGAWRSEDGGKSWTIGKGMHAEYMPPDQRDAPQIQDPHRLAQCPAAPEVVWCQHHNGVFRSTDGGLNWTEITAIAPSKFGFAVAVHPRDPNTAWFVPAVKDECRVPVDGRMVVARTTDGGRSFAVVRDGLPQDHAYDLVYRHALDVDDAGERLVMGSTTGGMWISEDGGGTWATLPARLPPVNFVRFARV